MYRLAEEIINGRRLKRGEDVFTLMLDDLEDVAAGADEIRKALCGDGVDLCSIINAKSGNCSENCKYCAQSAHNCTGVKEYSFLPCEEIVKACKANESEGVHRFSIVTSGKVLSDIDFEKALEAYKTMKKECPNIELCGSHGLLTYEQFVKLKESGVTMYHANIETSERFFPKICTTHTFSDKIECIKAAQKAGLSICSGGIIGMGEDMGDRIDMAFTLAELNIKSIPINALIPIEGTALEGRPTLTENEILRTVAIFRFINPTAYIRLAAGRSLMSESGREAFRSGANATITGNMLTTSGNNIKEDFEMLHSLGLNTERD